MDHNESEINIVFDEDYNNEDYLINLGSHIEHIIFTFKIDRQVNLDSLPNLTNLETITFNNFYRYPFSLPLNLKKIIVNIDEIDKEKNMLLGDIYFNYSEYIRRSRFYDYEGVDIDENIFSSLSFTICMGEHYENDVEICYNRTFGVDYVHHFLDIRGNNYVACRMLQTMNSIEEIDELLSSVNIKPANN